MSGKGEGTNPEQLFAAGYAACFIGALQVVGGKKHIRITDDVFSDSEVSFGPLAGGVEGVVIAVEIQFISWHREERHGRTGARGSSSLSIFQRYAWQHRRCSVSSLGWVLIGRMARIRFGAFQQQTELRSNVGVIRRPELTIMGFHDGA